MRKVAEIALGIFPVFKRWQVCCNKCGTVFYVDTEPNSIGEEIAELEDIRCGLHPVEGSVIELA